MSNNNAEQIESVISKSLKIGVILSAVITLVGFAMFLITGNSGYPDKFFPTDPLQIFAGVAALKPYAIILTGLMILILTPVLRVGISIILFLKEKDYKFTVITAVVFVILIISFLLGKVEQ
jgi:uncharacterized membrane protein